MLSAAKNLQADFKTRLLPQILRCAQHDMRDGLFQGMACYEKDLFTYHSERSEESAGSLADKTGAGDSSLRSE